MVSVALRLKITLQQSDDVMELQGHEGNYENVCFPTDRFLV